VLIRKNWGEHLPWIAGCLVAAALSVYWYFGLVEASGWDHRPTGGKGLPFWLGVAGGSICLFEFLLWPRKKLRAKRLGRTKVWMRAHIWLGLLAVPFLVLHSSFYFNNLEATVLFALFVVVIASGVWGLILQQFIPEKLLAECPAETIYSQIDYVSKQMAQEADRLVVDVCGVASAEENQPPRGAVTARQEEVVLARSAAGNHFTVGAMRVVGGLQGKVLESRAAYQAVPHSEALRDFFSAEVAEYLRGGKASGSALADRERSKTLFQGLRQKLPADAGPAVDSLENMCEQRRQMDHQAKLHVWLHNWLWVHLPLSVALIVLMFVHVAKTLQYKWPG
jgi:hypothetical protein